jgi:hypothetical protein
MVSVTLAVLVAVGAAHLARPANASADSFATDGALGSTVDFGVNTGVMFNGGHYTRAQIDAQLAALAKTGATVVRSDALWEDAEPQAPIGIFHRYNWTLDDLIMSSLAAHGLRWLPIIDYSAPWAKAAPGQIHSPPSSVSDYAAYAAAVASRYGPGGSFWLENPGLKQLPVLTYEIWNEPDNGTFWFPTANPAAYATLYAASRSAILAKQPGAHVLIGGLTRPAWFLQAMLASDPGLRNGIDGVAIHPYGGTPARVFANVRAARLAMRSNGIGAVPMYITEFGWTTQGNSSFDSASEAARPGYISTALSTLGHTDCGVAAVLLYAWTTGENNPANPQDWFGISPPGAGGSADTEAFTAGLQAGSAPAPPTLLCSSNPILPTARTLPLHARPSRRTHDTASARAAARRKRAKRARCSHAGARRKRCRVATRRK